MADAALILVNYNTAAETLEAIAALQGQGLPLELVVVDNASRLDERRRLQALPADVQVVQSETNLGYGGALNHAVPLTRAPVIGFLNPDTVPFPGAVKTLLSTLENDPEIAAVAPRTWWDAGRTLLLPPIRLPTLTDFLARGLGTLVPPAGLADSRRRARWTWTVGFGERLTFLPMLSGAFLLARRRVFEQVGGFDPRFPLYFEDADWCRRVRGAGYRLAYVPGAEIAHYFDQSARQVPAQAEIWRAQSLRHYLRKYYGPVAGPVVALLAAADRRAAGRRVPGLTDLGACSIPPRVALPPGTGAVQVAYRPLFFDAPLGPAEGADWQVPLAIWDRLRPGRYFLRALARDSWRPLRVWTWEKPA
jgi:hypothetical protein